MSETETTEERHTRFGREIVAISTVWTILVVGAGILMVLFRDAFV